MKWYNVDIYVNTREMLQRMEEFKAWLQDSGVKFGTSVVGENWIHFELLLEQGSIDIINEALDQIVWYDAIKEQ